MLVAYSYTESAINPVSVVSLATGRWGCRRTRIRPATR